MIKKLFLPVGMLLAVAVTLFTAAPGVALRTFPGSESLIMVIFLVSGMQADFRELALDRRFCALLVGGAVMTLVVAPVLTFELLNLLGFDPMLGTGLLVIMAAPPTLSSGIVITMTAGGSIMLALAITVIYNLLAVASMPLLLPLLLDETAVAASGALTMLWKLVLLVLLPFAIGALVRKIHPKRHWLVDYVPLVATVLVVWSFLGGAREMMLAVPVLTLLFTLLLCGVLHLLLLAALAGTGLILKAGRMELKAMVFCGGSKTVSIALAMLTIIGADSGTAVLPCLGFYLLQMLIDSFLALRVGLRDDRNSG